MVISLGLIEQTSSLNDRVYDLLKKAILQKKLPPGKRLDVNKLAQNWGVSRTPVNDALQRLMIEGLVEVLPRKGTFVSIINVDHVLELLDVRLMFELRAAELTIDKITEQRLEQLRNILTVSDALLKKPDMDYVAYTNEDVKFHDTMITWTENMQMLRAYKSQNFLWHTVRIYYENASPKVVEGQGDHWDMYRAYERASLQDLKDVIYRHIESAEQGIKKMVNDTPKP